METFVLGAGGLVGSNVIATAVDRGHDVAGTYHSSVPDLDVDCEQVDITDADAVAERVATHDPSHVVNCAAMTDVDACEDAPERARAVNAVAPREVAAACDRRGISFTHVSTDYVFDGEASTPYAVDATTNPIQTYGETKLDGERSVLEAHKDPTIVRLSFVYGIHRSNSELQGLPAWVRDKLSEGETTVLFTDQRVTPTRAGTAAETILDLDSLGATGSYHVAGRSCVTPFEIGARVRELMGAPAELLVKGSRTDLSRLAERPAYSCLETVAVEKKLGRELPTVREDLAAIESAFAVGPDA